MFPTREKEAVILAWVAVVFAGWDWTIPATKFALLRLTVATQSPATVTVATIAVIARSVTLQACAFPILPVTAKAMRSAQFARSVTERIVNLKQPLEARPLCLVTTKFAVSKVSVTLIPSKQRRAVAAKKGGRQSLTFTLVSTVYPIVSKGVSSRMAVRGAVLTLVLERPNVGAT